MSLEFFNQELQILTNVMHKQKTISHALVVGCGGSPEEQNLYQEYIY